MVSASHEKEPPAAGQVWSAQGYAHHAAFVPALGQDVLTLLDPKPHERILDLGCGDGVLTSRIAESGARVTGLEPDPELAAAARAQGLAVLEQDAHQAFGTRVFDAVFSNAALHWMQKPAIVFANVHEVLHPGGRFVAEQGGFGNVAAIVTAIRAALEAAGYRGSVVSPWDFPSPSLQRQRLESAGFDVVSIALISRPTSLPTGMAGWLQTFAGPFIAQLPSGDAVGVLQDAERRLTALHDPVEGWIADYVRLRFQAMRRA